MSRGSDIVADLARAGLDLADYEAYFEAPGDGTPQLKRTPLAKPGLSGGTTNFALDEGEIAREIGLCTSFSSEQDNFALGGAQMVARVEIKLSEEGLKNWLSMRDVVDSVCDLWLWVPMNNDLVLKLHLFVLDADAEHHGNFQSNFTSLKIKGHVRHHELMEVP